MHESSESYQFHAVIDLWASSIPERCFKVETTENEQKLFQAHKIEWHQKLISENRGDENARLENYRGKNGVQWKVKWYIFNIQDNVKVIKFDMIKTEHCFIISPS